MEKSLRLKLTMLALIAFGVLVLGYLGGLVYKQRKVDTVAPGTPTESVTQAHPDVAAPELVPQPTQ